MPTPSHMIFFNRLRMVDRPASAPRRRWCGGPARPALGPKTPFREDRRRAHSTPVEGGMNDATAGLLLPEGRGSCTLGRTRPARPRSGAFHPSPRARQLGRPYAGPNRQPMCAAHAITGTPSPLRRWQGPADQPLARPRPGGPGAGARCRQQRGLRRRGCGGHRAGRRDLDRTGSTSWSPCGRLPACCRRNGSSTSRAGMTLAYDTGSTRCSTSHRAASCRRSGSGNGTTSCRSMGGGRRCGSLDRHRGR